MQMKMFGRIAVPTLLAALLALMGIGLAVLYSAGNESPRLVMAQGARYVIGLGALWLLSRVMVATMRWPPTISSTTSSLTAPCFRATTLPLN